MALSFGKRRIMPMLLQAETTECGMCCVAMVAGYYGYVVDLVTLRRQFGISSQGATLKTLMEIAEEMGLTQRPVRLEMEELSHLQLPAVLHWEFDHFVVLKKITKNKLIVHDPAVGIRSFNLADAAKRFTGVALELVPRTTFELGDHRERVTIWEFWKGTKGLGMSLAQLFLLSVLIQLFALATPFYMQIVVDDVLVKRDVDLLIILAIGFLAITLMSVLTKAVRGFANLYLVNQLSYNVGNSLLHHLIRLPLSYFDKRHMGDVVSRFGSINPIQELVTSGFISASIDGLLAISTLALMFVYSWQLALVVCVAVVVYAIFRILQFRPLRDANHENIAASAKLDSIFMETIRSLQGIKVASKETERQLAWQHQFTESINTSARIGRLTIAYESANTALTGCEYVLVIYLGAQAVLDGSLTIGMLYAFLAYRTHFSSSVLSLINQIIQYWMIGLHLDRISDIALTEKEEGLETAAQLTLPIDGGLSLNQVSFRYGPKAPPLLSEVNLEVAAGKSVVVLGASGVGKTTLLKVMMGLLKPVEGEVLVDDIPLSLLGNKSFRQQISCVMQDDTLFSGSIRENITFFDVQTDVDMLKTACALSCISSDIAKMPMGYETLIGDMGSSLSVGQQQRVLLARALYTQPKILFLDEGTAHVDSATEHEIMKNLRKLDCTKIFITHNVELVSYADDVIVWSNVNQPAMVSGEDFKTQLQQPALPA